MPTHHDPVRETVRRLYIDGNDTIAEIAARFGVGRSTISRWVRLDGWPRRSTQPGGQRRAGKSPEAQHVKQMAESPEQRLRRLFELYLIKLEDRMTSKDPDAEPVGDRDARAMGGFTRAIEKIKEIEPGHGHADRGAPQSGSARRSDAAEEDRLRREIVDRLLKLRERKRAERAERQRAERGAAGDPGAE